MKPTVTLGEVRVESGAKFSLHAHDGAYFLKLDGTQLMSSTNTLSEQVLADVACPNRDIRPDARILIGGLGLGFSLKRVLEIAGPSWEVVVAELLPEVVRWNREYLMDLNGKLLSDPRVRVYQGDVYDCIAPSGKKWDAILLDTDNGPTSLVVPQNYRIYRDGGFGKIWDSLQAGGRVAFWAAGEEPGFERRLRRDGFFTRVHSAKAYPKAKREAHRIYVGEKR